MFAVLKGSACSAAWPLPLWSPNAFHCACADETPIAPMPKALLLLVLLPPLLPVLTGELPVVGQGLVFSWARLEAPTFFDR